jgi:mRNA interferase RelE/StbE
MKTFIILFTKQAKKDVEALDEKTKIKLKKILLDVIQKNPYKGKKLVGDLRGNYSFRLTIKDRIIYSVDTSTKKIYIKRARTHYE